MAAARPSRSKVVGRVADQLAARFPGHPLRVAVDGVTAAGKTTLADELAAAVGARGRSAVRLSMDDFHHPRARRHRQGRASARGYYKDAFDFETFARLVLAPLGPDGDRRYAPRAHDLDSDQPVHDSPQWAAADAVVIVDGSFLQNPTLDGGWDEVVYVDVSFAAACERGIRRDAAMFGGKENARELYASRYHAAGRLYQDEIHPAERATVRIGNDDLGAPVLHHIGGPADAAVTLFAYGTLQDPAVQQSSFGRTLSGRLDVLLGHHRDWVEITDPAVIAASGSTRHPLVRPTGDPDDQVPGTVLTLTTAELAAADLYEVDDYRRVDVRLRSGAHSWAYLAAGAGGEQRALP